MSLQTIAEFQYALEHDATSTTAPTRSMTNLQPNLKQSHLDPLEAADCITETCGD